MMANNFDNKSVSSKFANSEASLMLHAYVQEHEH